MSAPFKPLGEGYYQVSGMNSEGSWENLHGEGFKTLQEAEEVYQASDPLTYSLVQIHRAGELIMTSDPTQDAPLKEIKTQETFRLWQLRQQVGRKATGTTPKKGAKKFQPKKVDTNDQQRIRHKLKKYDR